MLPGLHFTATAERPAVHLVVAAMATDLVRLQATTSEVDAVRALMGRYGYGEIIAFAGAALELAQKAAS